MTARRVIRSEATKLFTAPSTWVLLAVTVLGTWPMAWSNAVAYTLPPEDPRLIGDLGPIEYHGFEMAGFGCAFIVVIGALWAAGEYGGARQIHTTLAATPRRSRLMAVKLLLLATTVACAAVAAMGGAVAITHAASHDGINPLVLTPQIWRLLGGLTTAWVTTALMAFAIGMLARNAVVPIITLLPLVIGLGSFLAQVWNVASYFPVTAGSALYSVPGTIGAPPPGLGGLVQVGWAVLCVAIAWVAFARRDA